jgi:hypothetical protein
MQIWFYVTTLYVHIEHTLYMLNFNVYFYIRASFILRGHTRHTVFLPDDRQYTAETIKRVYEYTLKL